MSTMPDTDPGRQARRRIAAYLRCLGISGETALDRAAESILRECGGDPARALDQAMALTAEPARLPNMTGEACRTCPCATPAERPATMPTQPLGELPRLLHRAFWRRQIAAIAGLLGRKRERHLQRG